MELTKKKKILLLGLKLDTDTLGKINWLTIIKLIKITFHYVNVNIVSMGVQFELDRNSFNICDTNYVTYN